MGDNDLDLEEEGDKAGGKERAANWAAEPGKQQQGGEGVKAVSAEEL